MKKHVLLLFLLFLGFVIMPNKVFASDETLLVTVDDTTYDILEGNVPEHVTYDEGTHTITLNGFVGKQISSSHIDLTIDLIGDNSITNLSDTSIDVSNGNLTVKGTGSLTINAENAYFVFVNMGDLIVNSGTITVNGPGDDGYGIGVKGDIIINGGVLNISSSRRAISVLIPDDGNNRKYVINGGEINITDCDFAMMFNRLDDTGDGEFYANGGSIHITHAEKAIEILGDFVLDGANITVVDSEYGFTDEQYLSNGILKFKSGSYTFTSLNLNEKYIEQAKYEIKDLELEEGQSYVQVSNNMYISDPDMFFQNELIHDSEENLSYTILFIDKDDPDFDSDKVREFSILTKKRYDVIDGDEQTINKHANSIEIDADINKFVALYINDELVGEDSYDLEEGSTIINLKDSYIRNLDDGEYTFRVDFTDGYAEGTFTIDSDAEEPADDSSDDEVDNKESVVPTGDSIFYSVLLFLISGISIVVIKKKA